MGFLDDIRKKAEELLNKDKSAQNYARDKNIHELRVSQIELELQNEELRRNRDIYEKRLAELESRLIAFEGYYENLPVGAFIVDEDFRILSANITASIQLGFDRDTIAGTKFHKLVAGDFQDEFHFLLNKLRRTMGAYQIEITLKIADGQTRDFLLQASSHMFEGKKQIIFSIMDISVRKSEEKNLKLQNIFNKAIIESSPDPIFVKDVSNRLVYCNSAFEKFSGKNRGELLNKDDVEIFEPNLSERLSRTASRAAESKTPARVRSYASGANGDVYYFDIILAPVFDQMNNLLGSAAFLRDITSMRGATEELKASSTRMRDALKGSELAFWEWNIADGSAYYSARFYEILGYRQGELEPTIKQWENLLHKEDAPSVLDAMADCLDGESQYFESEFRAMSKNMDWIWIYMRGRIIEYDENGAPFRMTGAAQDITERKNIEALLSGRLDLEARPFALRDLVGKTARMLSRKAGKDSVEILFDVAADVPDNLLGDAVRVRRVLLNILAGALKRAEKGEIIIYVKKNKIADDKADIEFYIVKSGIKASDDVMQKLFDNVSKSAFAHSFAGGGTALGLTISKRLIELMGGEINFVKDYGQGSALYFNLILGVDENAGVVDIDISKGDKPLKALIVDNNEKNLKILSDLLKSWKVNSETKSNGVNALVRVEESIAEGETFDLILLDFDMPYMGGAEVADKIRRLRGGEKIPIVMMIGGEKIASKANKIIDSPEALYVEKPVSHSDLLEAVKSALSGDSAQKKSPGDAEPELADLTILLSEDNEMYMSMATRMLKRKGWNVVQAENGKQAVETYKSRDDIGLVMLDLMTPYVDGYDAARAIRDYEKQTGKRVPIIAMTAYGMTGVKEKCLAVGMDDYLSKPIDMEILYMTIERVVRNDKQAEKK